MGTEYLENYFKIKRIAFLKEKTDKISLLFYFHIFTGNIFVSNIGNITKKNKKNQSQKRPNMALFPSFYVECRLDYIKKCPSPLKVKKRASYKKLALMRLVDFFHLIINHRERVHLQVK